MRFYWVALLAALVFPACDGGGETGQCTTARDCSPGETCIGGTCASAIRRGGCDKPEDCDPSEWCDIVDRQCKPLLNHDAGTVGTDAGAPDAKPNDGDAGANADGTVGDATPHDSGSRVCNSDPECGPQPQNICLSNTCNLGCTEPGGLMCTGGTTCDGMTGRCVTPTEMCMIDSDCDPAPPVQVCDNDVCVAGCVTNPNRCTAGTEICNNTTGRCEPAPIRCGMDTDCMPGPPMQVCEGTQCVPGCAEPGGLQCSGTTPFCNSMSGRCEAPPPCNLDADCGDPDQICVNMACVVRCDRPGAAMCNAPEVCNPENGRCVMGNQPLGQTCSFDAQCTTELCVGLNTGPMTVSYFCSQTCSGSGGCPIDFRCLDINGAGICIPESITTPPAQWDTAAGGMCTAMTATCQSGWCNTRDEVCLETCSRDADCNAHGGNCWTYDYTDSMSGAQLYEHLCVPNPGTPAGQGCTINSDCASGICNRYNTTCGQRCCADIECGAGNRCLVYDLDTTTGAAVKLCGPAPMNAGTAPLGASCTSVDDCASGACVPTVRTSSTSPRVCSTPCCSNTDCGALPGGGRCIPAGAGQINMVQVYSGLCFPN